MHPAPPATDTALSTGIADDLLDPELSLLAFQRRVIALAASRETPLAERLRFLGIVSSNLDELFMVRMTALRQEALDGGPESPAARRLAWIEQETDAVVAALEGATTRCLQDAKALGVRLVDWESLDVVARVRFRELYAREIQPGLLTHAITLTTGVPLPHLPHFGLFVGILYRDPAQGRLRLLEHELPRDLPRLLEVPGRPGWRIPIDEVLRANVGALHPTLDIVGVHLFRVTRGADLQLDDDSDLLTAVERATARRPLNPVVRVEVDRHMPAEFARTIIEGVRREAVERDPARGELALTTTRAQVTGGLLDLRCLDALPVPRSAPHVYPEFTARAPVPDSTPMLDAIRGHELLVHHPFESFDETVVRFFREAAEDPRVTSICATLYRVGSESPIAEALGHAARSGKAVFALVELQARFDEEHNVRWARAIERAGGRVVFGLPGVKVHAKAALVTRLEDGSERRYAHVGTGNYNPLSGRQYTDLSLFSARDSLTRDVRALFDAFAQESTAETPAPRGRPAALEHGALVSPEQLRPALLELIAREAEHARAGRASGITIKVNSIADREMARALYAASAAGVDVRLIVRGICIVRPGVAPYSSRLTVTSTVGRFLEHSRIYRFENAGDPVHLIGSSDLRPRNLRRRVELLVPILDAGHRARLDAILARYLNDSAGYILTQDGVYHQRGGDDMSAQDAFIAELGARG